MHSPCMRAECVGNRGSTKALFLFMICVPVWGRSCALEIYTYTLSHQYTCTRWMRSMKCRYIRWIRWMPPIRAEKLNLTVFVPTMVFLTNQFSLVFINWRNNSPVFASALILLIFRLVFHYRIFEYGRQYVGAENARSSVFIYRFVSIDSLDLDAILIHCGVEWRICEHAHTSGSFGVRPMPQRSFLLCRRNQSQSNRQESWFSSARIIWTSSRQVLPSPCGLVTIAVHGIEFFPLIIRGDLLCGAV